MKFFYYIAYENSSCPAKGGKYEGEVSYSSAAVFIVLVVLSIVHAQATYHVVGTVSCNSEPAKTGRAYIWTAVSGGSCLDTCCLDANSEYHFYMPSGTYWISIDSAAIIDEGVLSGQYYKIF